MNLISTARALIICDDKGGDEVAVCHIKQNISRNQNSRTDIRASAKIPFIGQGSTFRIHCITFEEDCITQVNRYTGLRMNDLGKSDHAFRRLIFRWWWRWRFAITIIRGTLNAAHIGIVFAG